jgi:hypothetical protein
VVGRADLLRAGAEGAISVADAKREALARIGGLRYGKELAGYEEASGAFERIATRIGAARRHVRARARGDGRPARAPRPPLPGVARS